MKRFRGWIPAGLDETFEAIVVDAEALDPVLMADARADRLATGRGLLDRLGRFGVPVIGLGAKATSAAGSRSSAEDGPGRRVTHADGRTGVAEAIRDRGHAMTARVVAGAELIGDAPAPGSAATVGVWLAGLGITGRLIVVLCSSCSPERGSAALACVDSQAWLRGAVVACLHEGDHKLGPEVLHPLAAVGGLRGMLAAQVGRRDERRVPQIDPDPEWVVPLGSESRLVDESLGSLANGRVGTRGSLEESTAPKSPALLVAGVYTAGDVLLEGPVWTDLDLAAGGSDRRLLDMRTGVLVRASVTAGGVRSLRFVSAADPAALGLRAEAPSGLPPSGEEVRPPLGGGVGWETAERDGRRAGRTGQVGRTGIFVAARDHIDRRGSGWCLERMAACATGEGPEGYDRAFDELSRLDTVGFDRLLARHRRAWANQWAGANVSIDGPHDDQLAARFALFHLLGAACGDGQVAVGARGLTGPAYGGHVFWDADVFVLPALAAVRPRAARAMLEYRIARLPAARAAARAGGRRGARFPWESAADGTDVTPESVRGPDGQLIPIETGIHEVHIVADVAWAAVRYAAWSGDREFITAGPGRDLVVETARYWASRARVDRSGVAHLYGVMGPDEYHQVVDDNAFTNVMARWNLRAGAELLSAGGEQSEATQMRSLADALVDGWDARRGIYEQFAGFYDLEPLDMAGIARPPVAIDVVLGPERVSGSQLIKQADVLMAHHMVPEQMEVGSLGPCLDFYGPRTAHGSSLSPAIHASLLARAGRPDQALEMFRLAAHLDLDDLTGTTAQGLHLATMGGLWQALAYGFLGLSVYDGVLHVDPCLPADWSSLGIRFSLSGQVVEVTAEPQAVRIACQVPLRVRRPDGRLQTCEPPSTTVRVGARR